MTVGVFFYVGALFLFFYILQMVKYGFRLATFTPQLASINKSCKIKVSLLVPVRNEISNLENLISDIKLQDYPHDLIEVIFINDHSDDGSEIFLRKICASNGNFRLLHLAEAVKGKKQAINFGVENAKGEWIIQTDADCRLPEGLVSGHLQLAYSENAALVAGPVLIQNESGLWHKLQSLELLSLTASGMASFLVGKPLICSGANLSYSKTFYQEVREELNKVTSPSGDDMFLLIQAKKKRKKLAYLSALSFIVTTTADSGLLEFYLQRLRWGSKARYYTDPGLIVLSILVWLVNLIITIVLIASFFLPDFLPLFMIFLLVKSLADFVVLYSAASIFKKKYLLWVFPLAAVFYYFYITLAGMGSLFGRVSWKGRTY